jgi:deoxyribose-phosphate aldolase
MPRAASSSSSRHLPPAVVVDAVMAQQRAASFTKRSIKNATKKALLLKAISLIDLTTLEGKDTPQKVKALCQKAVQPDVGGTLKDVVVPPVAAVCVYPSLVKVARKTLDNLGEIGKKVKVASVATGFPSGQYPLDVRIDDTKRAIDDGADEIDMVISRHMALRGEWSQLFDEVAAITEACGKLANPAAGRGSSSPIWRGAHLKVILETGELETLDTVRRASDVSIAAMHHIGITAQPGAGFIKTSTGKVEPAATMPVVLVMLQAIADHFDATGEKVGMKPAGGIRTAKQALHHLVMLDEVLGVLDETDTASKDHPRGWMHQHLYRLGASALLNDLLRQLQWLQQGKYAARYDFADA